MQPEYEKIMLEEKEKKQMFPYLNTNPFTFLLYFIMSSLHTKLSIGINQTENICSLKKIKDKKSLHFVLLLLFFVACSLQQQQKQRTSVANWTEQQHSELLAS